MNDQKIRRRAYLVATLQNVGTPVPVVVHVGIYSSSANGLTGPMSKNQIYVDIVHHEADDYGQAEDELIAWIRDFPPLSWAIPWVEKSEDAHRARYFWQQLPKR